MRNQRVFKFPTFLLTLVLLFSLVLSACTTNKADESGSETETIAVTDEAASTSADAASSAESTEKADADADTDEGAVVLYLIRHGKTIMNTLDLVQGWSDSPLTDAGVVVAEDAAAGLADEGIVFDYAYSSDRGRAIETAEIILDANKASDLTLNTVVGLRETYFGSFEGEPNKYMWGKIAEHYGVEDINAVVDLVGAENVFSVVPELDPSGTAESHETLVERLVASFDEIAKEVETLGGGNVLVVGHGASLLTAIGELTGASDLPTGLTNASVSKIIYKDGVYTLEYVDNNEFTEAGALIRAEKEKPVTIYLARHGKTEFNTAGRVQGWIDSPLTEDGRTVATHLGIGLADIDFSSVYTSGMGRAVETAQLVLKENSTGSDLPLQTSTGLRETNYGTYEGGTNEAMLGAALEYYGAASLDELATEDQSMLERVLYHNYISDETGAAENLFELRARVNTAFEEVVKEASQNGGGNILVVSHGNAIMAILEELGIKDAGEISNASITKIIYENGVYTVEVVNDLSYVEAGAAASK